jgi:hypothetical protein
MIFVSKNMQLNNIVAYIARGKNCEDSSDNRC